MGTLVGGGYDRLIRNWWAIALRGALAVLLGLFLMVLALVWPGMTLLVLAVAFGVFAIADGAVAAVTAVRSAAGHRALPATHAVLGVLIGLLALGWPLYAVVALVYVLGAWAIVIGAVEITASVRGRPATEWTLLLAGALSVLFGLLLWAWPVTGAVAIALLLGAYGIVFGAVLVAAALRLRSAGRSRAGTWHGPVR